MQPGDFENARLLAQADAFATDEHIREEASRWREASPAQRLAETWRLAGLFPWFRSMWSEELRERAAEPDPLPRETLALLERMKMHGRE